ncbi:conjugal transfer protein TraG N-terminal domain-containing protein [Thermodesulfovibrio sp. TK110]
MTLDVYTVGGIEFLSQVYKGIVMILGDSGFESLLRLAAFFTVVASVLALIAKQQFESLLKRMGMIFFISAICFGLRANVNIIDTKYQQTYVVSDVPMLPAYAHSFLSSASYFLTNTAQNVFHTGTVNVYNPGAMAKNAWSSINLDYNKTGYGGFFDIVSYISKFDLKTVSKADIQEYYNYLLPFMKQCIVPNIGYMDFQKIKKNILECNSLINCFDISSNSDFANLFISYNGQTYDCATFFVNEIKPRYNNLVAYGSDPTSLIAFGIPPTDAQALSDAFGSLLSAGAVSLSDMIGQAGMLYAFLDGVDAFLSDSPDALQNFAYKYEAGRNIEESKQMGKTLGIYAKETIPLMKNAFEAIMVAFIPIFFLIIMFGGAKAIRNVFISMAWVYMWDPVLATINGIGNIAAIAKVNAAIAQSGQIGALTYSSLNTIFQNMDYFPAVMGYLAISTPGLAYMLIKGGEITMANIASMMATPVMTTPIHSEVATSAETQKIASQTGLSFGQVEYAYNAQGQAKLHALAFQQGLAQQMSYAKLLQADIGSQQMGYTDGLAASKAIKKHGLENIIDSKTNLLSQTIGSGIGFGNQDRAFQTGLVNTQRAVAEAEAFASVANKYGGVEKLANLIATRNYTHLSSALKEYAELRGISIMEAATEMGYFMGEKDATSVTGYANASETVGKQQIAFTEANKILNETAKFEMTYQFAHAAGYAKSKDDFLGVYLAHLRHHAEETWTLDKTSAEFLNQQMASLGYKTRFKAGDRVTMAMDEYGNITLAKGAHGASREVLDITKAVYGRSTDIYHGNVNHHLGQNWSTGNDIVYAVASGDSKGFHRFYGGQMWYNMTAGQAITKQVADALQSFGNLGANLQKISSLGLKVSSPLGFKVLAALGVQFSESGEIRGADNVDASKLQIKLQEAYKDLYSNKNLTSYQKTQMFIQGANEIYSLFQQITKESPSSRVSDAALDPQGKSKDTIQYQMIRSVDQTFATKPEDLKL